MRGPRLDNLTSACDARMGRVQLRTKSEDDVAIPALLNTPTQFAASSAPETWRFRGRNDVLNRREHG